MRQRLADSLRTPSDFSGFGAVCGSMPPPLVRRSAQNRFRKSIRFTCPGAMPRIPLAVDPPCPNPTGLNMKPTWRCSTASGKRSPRGRPAPREPYRPGCGFRRRRRIVSTASALSGGAGGGAQPVTCPPRPRCPESGWRSGRGQGLVWNGRSPGEKGRHRSCLLDGDLGEGCPSCTVAAYAYAPDK